VHQHADAVFLWVGLHSRDIPADGGALPVGIAAFGYLANLFGLSFEILGTYLLRHLHIRQGFEPLKVTSPLVDRSPSSCCVHALRQRLREIGNLGLSGPLGRLRRGSACQPDRP